MKPIKIGYNELLKKETIKLSYHGDEIPGLQLFNANDIILGNPNSNIAMAFVYTWKDDTAPKLIREYMQKLANYNYITGLWRTTNGAKYVFSNILANPNVNKFVIVVFNQKDNGHLLAEALKKFWQNGVDENGIIKGSNSPNPKFEQAPKEALERIRTQCDLIILSHITENNAGFEIIENISKACIQEPRNAVAISAISTISSFAGINLAGVNKELINKQLVNIDFYSNYYPLFGKTTQTAHLIYDDGARFTESFKFDLSGTARKVHYEQKELITTIGQSIQAETLEDAHEAVAAFIFKNGFTLVDQRNIITLECRTFTVTILDALKKIPDGFSQDYLKRYVNEFLNGIACENANEDDESAVQNKFVYTYHDRIFKKWGNQYEKVVQLLKQHSNTRRAMISLWDPSSDVQNSNAPCLDFIWAVIRNNKLEFHVVYRSHHLATVTKSGKLMKGEGAFVPNLYAIATMQEKMAKELAENENESGTEKKELGKYSEKDEIKIENDEPKPEQNEKKHGTEKKELEKDEKKLRTKLSIERGPLILTDFSGHLYVSDVK